jgi:hypothetical protein
MRDAIVGPFVIERKLRMRDIAQARMPYTLCPYAPVCSCPHAPMRKCERGESNPHGLSATGS